ncbi:polysaccharide deacetylase family protein [Fervidibacillus albus]|uniref:Polysaccharide deacetylase family protein n=1 Tax=Fervidibacillus albus TaxID=2980026 RepID=A0A9E8LTK9_9BACI|nr:polysaccharide deacetylase family protein [Fervidibacillus albus]WAA08559.1 polysaccharide deacetylase family protein [Fervidibacillus albus]
MKRYIENVFFTASFIVIFAFIIKTFSSYFIQAVTHQIPVFPANRSLFSEQEQKWTDNVRFFDLAEGEQAEQVTVLLYHRVIDDQDISKIHYGNDGKLYDTIVKRSEFEKQMNYLREENYVTLTAKEFQLFMQGNLNVPKKSVVITFDDGFKDNFVEAYPILKANNFSAINFLITGFVSERNEKYQASNAQYFSLDEIKQSSSVFEFLSHTYNFHRKTKEGMAYLKAKSKEEVKEDISTSLINLNGRNRAFAYPYGEYNEETINILKELGIEMAFTVEYKDAKPGLSMYEIPRKTVFPEDTIRDFIAKIHHD